MEQKLEEVVRLFKDIELKLSDPSIVSDQNLFRDINKEHSRLLPIVEAYNEYKQFKSDFSDAQELLKSETDAEMIEMLKIEASELEEKIEEYDDKLMIMLLPKDPNSGKNAIVEIRAGTGGDEAALFAADLFRMYARYCDVNGFKLEIMEMNATEMDGYKEIIFSVSGEEAYDNLKYESGGHRVQRIPSTESGGRIHTSAVTVAVMPEAEERDFEISENDLRIDVYRSSGHGGQSVNTTDSAVRITHIPTGTIVTCQDEKSQIKNKAKALRVLRSRLYEKEREEQMSKESELRKSLVGSGDRSQRIRTYNFPQSRVTDHRVGLTSHNLEGILGGELTEIIDALKSYEVAEQLKASN